LSRQILFFLRGGNIALRTPEERLPSGAPKEEFGRMIFQKKSFLGDRTKFASTTTAGARGGPGTCDALCLLGRVLDSAFILSISVYIFHSKPPRAPAAEL